MFTQDQYEEVNWEDMFQSKLHMFQSIQLYQTALPLMFVGKSINSGRGNRARLVDLITLQHSI